MRLSLAVPAAVATSIVPAVLALASCGGAPSASQDEPTATTADALTGSDVATLALANVGGMACAKNSLGGTTFDSSCTGNGGQPEYWCADFARWAWEHTGASNTSELTAAAGSFYVYGQKPTFSRCRCTSFPPKRARRSTRAARRVAAAAPAMTAAQGRPSTTTLAARGRARRLTPGSALSRLTRRRGAPEAAP